MPFVFDSDGLIKLNLAGVLQHVIQSFDCIVPQAVVDEVITRGRERGYQDVSEIEAVLAGAEIVPAGEGANVPVRLGLGELAILELVPSLSDAIIISDDRRFTNFLAAEGIPFLVTAGVLLTLVRRSVLSKEEAQEALERLKPLVRSTAYWEVRTALATEGGEKI
jgi:rRNA-processing protein FCF1